MSGSKGWALSLPYFGNDAHVLRMMGEPDYPRRGPAVYTAAYLGPEWSTFHDPAALVSRVVERLMMGAWLTFYWKPGDKGPARKTLVDQLTARGFVCHEDDDVGDGFVFQAFEGTPQRVGLYRPWRKPDKALLVMRFGAYGDQLMAASVLPALKAEGWDITWLGPVEAQTVLRHDPHIDRFLLFPRDAVGEGSKLVEFIEAWSERFDRSINLNATVERALLYRPDQHEFYRDDETRRRLCAFNYLDYTHHVAGVPAGPGQRFYPSHAEADAAAAFVAKHSPLAIVCLTGSAEHKIWPHLPECVSRLLAETDLFVGVAGSEREGAMFAEMRAHVGRWLGRRKLERLIDMTRNDIRSTMSIACQATVVIGPETGVTNAVALEPAVGKVVLLSHSTVLNLTRDWPHTISLSGNVPCYPCHRLHETTKHCPRGPLTKRAACAEAIPPVAVVDAVARIMGSPSASAKVA